MATLKTTVLAWIGSAVLVGTVAFHLTGLPMMAEAAETPGLGGFVASALRPLWLFPAIRRRIERAIGRALAVAAAVALVFLIVIVTVQPV